MFSVLHLESELFENKIKSKKCLRQIRDINEVRTKLAFQNLEKITIIELTAQPFSTRRALN